MFNWNNISVIKYSTFLLNEEFLIPYGIFNKGVLNNNLCLLYFIGNKNKLLSNDFDL